MLGRGKTGSGKTLAFSIPMVARLGGELAGGKRRPGRPLGLVLAPTRELATQIDAVLAPLATAYGLTTTTIFGGVTQKRQVEALRAGVDIVVACPGRLEDLMKQGFVTLDAVEITVLDEADHMADLGFLPGRHAHHGQDARRAASACCSRATLDNGVDKLVKRFLQNEVLHSVDEANSPRRRDDPPRVRGRRRRRQEGPRHDPRLGHRPPHPLHAHQAPRQEAREAAHRRRASPRSTCTATCRSRSATATSPRSPTGAARVLVATDVAARGVHVDDVELVIHVDPPTEHKAYLHRSGRTARAGSEGDVVTVVPARAEAGPRRRCSARPPSR